MSLTPRMAPDRAIDIVMTIKALLGTPSADETTFTQTSDDL